MPPKQLDNLAKIGKLKSEPPARGEIVGLQRSGKVRLKDSQQKTLSIDSAFDLAYNAAHSFALAALRWHGFRSENRYLVFQCLEHTLGILPESWRVLDDAHRKRNTIEYEGLADISQQLLEAVLRVTREIAARVHALGPVDAS